MWLQRGVADMQSMEIGPRMAVMHCYILEQIMPFSSDVLCV